MDFTVEEKTERSSAACSSGIDFEIKIMAVPWVTAHRASASRVCSSGVGPERYTLAFVDGFLRTNSHFTVPLEAHTFALESKFAQNPEDGFSVEEQVRAWIKERRY